MLAPEHVQTGEYSAYIHTLVIEKNQAPSSKRGRYMVSASVVTMSPVNHGSELNPTNQAEHLLSGQVQSSREEDDLCSFGGVPSEESDW